jgi:hypothetical protein
MLYVPAVDGPVNCKYLLEPDVVIVAEEIPPLFLIVIVFVNA